MEAMQRLLVHRPDTRTLIFSMHEEVIFAKRDITPSLRCISFAAYTSELSSQQAPI
jgi:hypothetical protein